MKKIILLLGVILLFSFSSCSNDDSNNNSTTFKNTLTAKINGAQKSFSVITITPINYDTYTDVEVSASVKDEPTTTFEMSLGQGSEGTMFFTQYSINGEYYQPTSSYNCIISENTEHTLKGTFSGTMQLTAEPFTEITITDGSFNLKY